MYQLCKKTRDGVSPHEKCRIYFTSHPNDFDLYFEETANDILELYNCVVLYDEDLRIERDPGEMDKNLSEIQLFVVPVSLDFLKSDNRARCVEWEYAVSHHIPILPMVFDSIFSGLEKEKSDLTAECFKELYGCYPLLHKYNFDPADIPYKEKLEKCLKLAFMFDDPEINNNDENREFTHALNYLGGIGCEIDRETAFSLISDAAERADINAMEKMSFMCRYGEGTEESYISAVHWICRLKEEYTERFQKSGAKSDFLALFSTLSEFGEICKEKDAYSSSANYYKEMVQIAEGSGSNEYIYGKAVFFGFFNLGRIAEKENAEESYGYYEKCLAAAKKTAELCKTREAERDLALIYNELSSFDAVLHKSLSECRDFSEIQKEHISKGISVLERHSRECESIEAQNEIMYFYHCRGNKELRYGECEQAERYYKKNIAIAEDISDEIGMVRANRIIGESYLSIGDSAESIAESRNARMYYLKAASAYEKLVKITGSFWDMHRLFEIYGKITDTIYTSDGDYGKQIEKKYLKKSLTLSKNITAIADDEIYKEKTAECYRRLGDIEHEGKRYSSAKDCYQKAVVEYEKLTEISDDPEHLLSLSFLYSQMVKNAEKLRYSDKLYDRWTYFIRSNNIMADLAERYPKKYTHPRDDKFIKAEMGNLAYEFLQRPAVSFLMFIACVTTVEPAVNKLHDIPLAIIFAVLSVGFFAKLIYDIKKYLMFLIKAPKLKKRPDSAKNK